MHKFTFNSAVSASQRAGWYIAVMTMVFLGSAVTTQAASLESVFDTQGTRWVADPVSEPAPKYPSANGAGYSFTGDFGKLKPELGEWRILWDAKGLNVDMSQVASLSLRVDVQNAAAIKSLTLYVASGGAWRYQTFFLQDGPNHLTANLGNFASQGTWPAAGWSKIDTVRVSAQRHSEAVGNATLTLYVKTSSTPGKDALGEEPNFVWPAEDKNIQRLVRRDAEGRLLESRALFDEEYYMVEGVDNVLNRISRAGFNVYIPGAWLGGGAFYNKRAPVDPLTGDKLLQPAYKHKIEMEDPMATLITKARKANIQVHPSFTISQRFFNVLPQYAPDGVTVHDNGIRSFEVHDPDYRTFIVNLIVDFVREYQPDGINLDYVRTIGDSTSEKAVRAFNERHPDENLLDEINSSDPIHRQHLLEWQGAAITDIVSRVSNAVRYWKPGIIISVDGHPAPSPTLDRQGRNEWQWVENGWVDVSYDMDYARRPDIGNLAKVRDLSPRPQWFTKILGNVESTGPRDAALVAELTEYFLRKFPERGIALYHYGRLSEEQISALRGTPLGTLPGPGPFYETALASWSFDEVHIGHAESEDLHNLEGINTSSGPFGDRYWRDATNGGWFSYDMKVAANRPMELQIMYWGGDAGRTFDIIIDDAPLTQQPETLNGSQPGKFFSKTYQIPQSMTAGKLNVTVKLQARPGSTAGGIFALSMHRR